MRNCIVDGCQGSHVPKSFEACYTASEWGISEEDASILRKGPDHEFYWETWDEVLDYAQFTDDKGRIWFLWQEGDLFAVSQSIKVKFVTVREKPVFDCEDELIGTNDEITEEITEEFIDAESASESIRDAGCFQPSCSQAPGTIHDSVWFDSESLAADTEDFKSGSTHKTSAFITEVDDLETLQEIWKGVQK